MNRNRRQRRDVRFGRAARQQGMSRRRFLGTAAAGVGAAAIGASGVSSAVGPGDPNIRKPLPAGGSIPASGGESEIWVYPTGTAPTDKDNVQWAVSNVALNGTVKLMAHKWALMPQQITTPFNFGSGYVYISKGVTLTAAASQPVPGSPISEWTGLPKDRTWSTKMKSNLYGFYVRCLGANRNDNVVIENIDITTVVFGILHKGGDSPSDRRDGGNLTVRNCKMLTTGYPGMSSSYGKGILSYHVGNVALIVEGCDLTSYANDVVQTYFTEHSLVKCTNCVLAGNPASTLTQNDFETMCLYNQDGNIIFKDNEAYPVGGGAVVDIFNVSSPVDITHNYIEGGEGNEGIFLNSFNENAGVIQDNVIHVDNGTHLIQLGYAILGYGPAADKANGMLIANNTITGTGFSAISMVDCPENRWEDLVGPHDPVPNQSSNNVFTNNDISGFVASEEQVFLSPTVHGNYFGYNPDTDTYDPNFFGGLSHPPKQNSARIIVEGYDNHFVGNEYVGDVQPWEEGHGIWLMMPFSYGNTVCGPFIENPKPGRTIFNYWKDQSEQNNIEEEC